MSKIIDIGDIQVRTPTYIKIDGKVYPLTGWNRQVINEYWTSGNEDILEKLKDFSLDI